MGFILIGKDTEANTYTGCYVSHNTEHADYVETLDGWDIYTAPTFLSVLQSRWENPAIIPPSISLKYMGQMAGVLITLQLGGEQRALDTLVALKDSMTVESNPDVVFIDALLDGLV